MSPRPPSTSPAEYDHWDELIDKLAAHLVERYSASDLRDWFFEVWNDHPGFRLKCGAYWKCRPQRRVIIAHSLNTTTGTGSSS